VKCVYSRANFETIQSSLAIERICLDVMERVTRGVGARGLLPPATFSKQLRNLTMYLRQPAPDQALAEVGKQALL
jgi:hypothetical protein